MEFIDIEIPNFFTPDGDGFRDTWVIRNAEGFPDIYVKIFDRYGRTVKEWIRQGEWDGSYNKADLPTGDYWYVIKLNGPNDDREFVGHVTIYR
jgi:gliding motility-associated-like protein